MCLSSSQALLCSLFRRYCPHIADTPLKPRSRRLRSLGAGTGGMFLCIGGSLILTHVWRWMYAGVDLTRGATRRHHAMSWDISSNLPPVLCGVWQLETRTLTDETEVSMVHRTILRTAGGLDWSGLVKPLPVTCQPGQQPSVATSAI